MDGSVSRGDFDTILEDLEEDYFTPNFKAYVLKEQLNSWRFDDGYRNSGWVFWSEQDHEIEPSLSLSANNCADFNPNFCAIPKVRDNIRRALQKLIPSESWFYGCLVQFWAATKTLEGRTKLTTQYQPFSLGINNCDIGRQDLCEYRMKISKYNNCFYADAESGEEQLGLPGRVFHSKSPEFTPNVEYYSKKEYPQINDAIRCFILGSWVLPVFEYSSKTCVGVLEMVSQDFRSLVYESFLHNMHDIFQEFDLICLDGYTHYKMQCMGDSSKREDALKELEMVFSLVCKIQELPLALTWIPCSACNDLKRGQFMFKDEENVEDTDEENVEDTDEENVIALISKLTHLRKGGVSERALSSPCIYCPDITQLSIAEYPLVHYARWCELSDLFTICLHSSYTENEVYVVEFFLSTRRKGDENILTTLRLILGTMEENFKTFKLASGQQLGEISPAEVMGFQNGQKLPFVQMTQAPRLSTSPELLKDRGLMFQLGQRQLNSPHQPPLDPSNDGHNGVTSEENITVVTSLEEGKRKTQRQNKGTGVRIEVSLDDILKCAKMKRKEAAEELKVSESTFKRVCREHGINRWPPRNIKTISQLPLSHVENQGQTLQLNSDLPSNQAVPGVAHMKPGVQDENRVTIRAKYKNKTIKFHLSFSSRLVEFEQEVAKRLHLEAGTYYAEYKDEEGVLIFIACDDDLQDCMHTSRSQGNTSIEVQLKLEEHLM